MADAVAAMACGRRTIDIEQDGEVLFRTRVEGSTAGGRAHPPDVRVLRWAWRRGASCSVVVRVQWTCGGLASRPAGRDGPCGRPGSASHRLRARRTLPSQGFRGSRDRSHLLVADRRDAVRPNQSGDRSRDASAAGYDHDGGSPGFREMTVGA
jgi:hypothetical protein